MKQSGECPKCGSLEIWNNIHIKRRNKLRYYILVDSSFLKPRWAKEIIYVCISCGFEETYTDSEGLDIIREYGMALMKEKIYDN